MQPTIAGRLGGSSALETARSNLLLGKLVIVAGLAFTAIVLQLIASVVDVVVNASIFERQLSFGINGTDVGRFTALLGLSWLRIIQFTMLALLAAVLTRSLLVAVIVPLVVGVSQFFTPQFLLYIGAAPDTWLAVLVNPWLAANLLQAKLLGATQAAALKASVSLALWTLIPLVGAMAYFKRQDLSKE